MLRAAHRAGDSTGVDLPPIRSTAEAQAILDAATRARLDKLEARRSAGQHVASAAFVLAYAELRDTTHLIAWLDTLESRREPSTANFLLNPLLDFARNDPRYLAWHDRPTWLPKPSR